MSHLPEPPGAPSPPAKSSFTAPTASSAFKAGRSTGGATAGAGGSAPRPSGSRRATDGEDGSAGGAIQVSERVRVVLRVRPPLSADETAQEQGPLAIDADKHSVLLDRSIGAVANMPSEFKFDQVLHPGASQSDVFNAGVRDVVDEVLKGYNGTVMAYGQTSAGKTYTLGNNEPHAIGMIPRCAAEIFAKAKADPFHAYSVSMSYIQIYMELLQDLLQPDAEGLQIREEPGSGVYLSGATEAPVTSLEECLHFLELGGRNRSSAFTQLNAHSSRSHAVVCFTVVKSRKYLTNAEKADVRKAEKEGGGTQKVKVGKLYLVDLAGSERIKKSRSVGVRASEAISINKSLTTLGMCISARAAEAAHVPFRDSKLTRLLQESLGGNAKTTLVVCVADAACHADETQQTLQFDARAMCVRTRAVVNEQLFGARAMCVRTRAVVNERSVDYRSLHAQLMGQFDGVQDRAFDLEAAVLRVEEERDAKHEELEREKAHFAGLLAELKAESAEEVQAVQQQLSLREANLSVVHQERAQLEVRVVQLATEREAMAVAHYAEVYQLNAQAASERAASAQAAAHSQAAESALAAQLRAAHAESACLRAELGSVWEELGAANVAMSSLE
ncbi:hypothetical protein FOA52_012098, partial [Chlamydomonas sp. UWO 241]